ncbi:MAG: hypothetical protein GX491_01380 [Chloroflexi bacterium]|nr:hypothetical protein [Chloroflexota bacterium]
METYSFVTKWTFDAPVEPVWNILTCFDEYPNWWRGWKESQRISTENGQLCIGGMRTNTVRGFLPYNLRFRTCLSKINPPTYLEIESKGYFLGTGAWELEQKGLVTAVQWTWNVCTADPVLNAIARLPGMKRIMEMNHDYLMRQGYHGVMRQLTRPRKPAEPVASKTGLGGYP